PVTSSELAAAPVAVWLLGHVHKPDLGVPAGSGGGGWVRGGQLGGYLGSLSPGDPGEEGPRGAWLVEITADAVGASHVPLVGLRYETLVLDVGGLDDPAALGPLVVSSVSEFVTGLIAEVPATAVALRALGVRLRLVGRSPVRAELAVRLVHDDPREAVIHVGGVAAFIHDVRLEALPAIDLSAVAAGRDPLALAARKLLLLGEPTNPATAALIAAARAHLAGVAGGKYYTALADLDLSDAAVTERLRVAALALIDGMDQ